MSRRRLGVLIPTALYAGFMLNAGGTEADSPAGTFPLHPSSDGRFLVDARGQAFLVNGDSPWSLVWKATPAEQDEYIDAAQRLGFNALLLDCVPFCGETGRAQTLVNSAGEAAFALRADGKADLSKPNAKYFDTLHRVVARLRDRDMLAALVVIDFGYNTYGPTWLDQVKLNGPAACRAYSKFLGERLRDCPNILWIQGGDSDPNGAEPEIAALAAGILESHHPSVLQTYHAAAKATSAFYPDTAWCTVRSLYTYEDPPYLYGQGLRDWYERVPRPALLLESGYEGEANDGVPGVPARVRRQAYTALLSGACGHFYGSVNWTQPSNWRDVQRWPGAKQMRHVRDLLATIPFSQLEPFRPVDFVVDGQAGANRYVAAAKRHDGKVALIYFPEIRSVTLDLAQLARGAAWVQWWDPTTGQPLATPTHSTKKPAGSAYTKSAESFQPFRPPGKNAAGDEDWVLRIEIEP